MNPYENIVQAMRQLNLHIAHEGGEILDSPARQAWRCLKETLPCVSALMAEHHDGECHRANRHLGQACFCPHCQVEHHLKH